MPKLTLQHPIHTLDHQLLLPPGTFLTKEGLDVFLSSEKRFPHPSLPLLLHGSVKEDCLNFVSNPPYDVIFSDKKEVNDLLKVLEAVRLSIPIFQSLDYFKENDFYTYAHVLMVFTLSTLLAKDLIPDDEACLQLSSTGPTHDLGKICVPLHILIKRTPLTQNERGLIEHHTAAGYVLLNYYCKDIQPLACRVALDHHERRDGSGYPRGNVLKDPLVEIIAVSDIYDALIVPRPYRSTAYDNRAALEEITKMAEQNKIGWDGVKALIAHNRKLKPDYREIEISAEMRSTPPSSNVYGIIDDGEKGDSKD